MRAYGTIEGFVIILKERETSAYRRLEYTNKQYLVSHSPVAALKVQGEQQDHNSWIASACN